jgi:hypothetical protein
MSAIGPKVHMTEEMQRFAMLMYANFASNWGVRQAIFEEYKVWVTYSQLRRFNLDRPSAYYKPPDWMVNAWNVERNRIPDQARKAVARLRLRAERIAEFDVRNIVDEDGDLLPIHMLDDDGAAGIASVEIQEVFEGPPDDRRLTGYIKKYKFLSPEGMIKYLWDREEGPVAQKMDLVSDGQPLKALIGVDVDAI